MNIDELKNKEQDVRLDKIETKLTLIESVTHGSDLHNWDGIVKEHNKLMGKISSSFIGIITTLITVVGGIIVALVKFL